MEINVYDIVGKLIGAIEPVGETQTDNILFENLKAMTELVEALLADINEVAWRFKNCHEHSIKKACDYARKFLDNIEIQE